MMEKWEKMMGKWKKMEEKMKGRMKLIMVELEGMKRREEEWRREKERERGWRKEWKS